MHRNSCRGRQRCQRKDKIPAATQPYYDQISAITDTICREHLNEEYAEICRKLVGALARKRPSPIVRGKPEIWAAGVLHALGMVNFLFDSAQTPHVRSEELNAFCGVAQSSMAAKSKLIREMFDMCRSIRSGACPAASIPTPWCGISWSTTTSSMRALHRARFRSKPIGLA